MSVAVPRLASRVDDLPTLLRSAARERPAQPVLTFPVTGESATYAELDRRTEELAAGLRALGVGTGDRVAVMLGNRLAFPVAWLAVVKAGAVTVPIIASGGVGTVGHFVEGALAGASGLLAASVFHYGEFRIADAKAALAAAGLPVRPLAEAA